MNSHLVIFQLLQILNCFLFVIHISVPSVVQALPTNQPSKGLDILSKVCTENAKLGNQANPDILLLCSNNFNTSVQHSTFCKPIPKRAKQKKVEDFDKFLSDGVEYMNDQVLSYTSRNTKLYRAVFIMGNNGSGKTTLSKILSKNLNHLEATYTDDKHLHIFENQDTTKNPKALKFQGVVPVYVVNYENNVAFWDCPGFDDKRDTEMDIATKYFIQRAVDLTSRAKFIFTVTHAAFKKENDINEFDLLVENAISLFKNLSKFEDSIGIVVTKVENYTPDGKHRNEEEIVAEIRESMTFYLNTKIQLLTREQQEETKFELRNKMLFVEALIGKGKNASSKISLARIPNQCGPLSTMPQVSKSRREVTIMFQKMLNYSSIKSDDLQFKSKTDLEQKLDQNVIPNTLAKFESIVSAIAFDVQSRFPNKFYENLKENLDTKIELLFNITHIFDEMKNITTSKENDSTEKYFSKHVEHLLQTIGLNMRCSRILTLFELENHIAFFKKIKKQNDLSFKLTKIYANTFAQFLKNCEYLLEFYQTCYTIKKDLNEPKRQLILLIRQTSSEILNNDEKFIERIFQTNIFGTSPLKLKTWNSTKPEEKRFLASLIRSVVSESEFKCLKSYADGSKIIVVLKGNNVFLSELFKNQTLLNCANGKPIVEINVFAKNCVYIDTDIYPRTRETDLPQPVPQEAFPGIESVQQIDMSIIALKWVVIGDRQIILDGFQPVDLQQAESGILYGNNGSHGNPGSAGGNAGNFFGMYFFIQKGDRLSISANGGHGGNGQQGGNGHEGQKGKNAEYDDLPFAVNLEVCNPNFNHMEFGRRGKGERSKEYDWKRMESCRNDKTKFIGEYYSKMGATGYPGGNGGNGGKGGDPGNLGQIEIIYPWAFSLNFFYDMFGIKEPTNKEGLCGKPGLGGTGGLGGLNGNYHSCKYTPVKWTQCESIPDKFRSGQNGENGEKGELCSNNTKHVATSKFQPWRALTKFRIDYFRETDYQTRIFFGFQGSLSAFPYERVDELTPLISLAIEIESIEGKIFEIGNVLSESEQIVYRKYYEDFLDRLEKYFGVRSLTEFVSIQDRLSLKMIFSAVLGKQVALKRKENQLTVIKVQQYFDSLTSQMTLLKSKQRETQISHETHIYKSRLNDKVNEAVDFIKTTVNPAIESAHRGLERSNEKLLQEINEYLKLAEDDVKQKKKFKKHLESATKVNLIFDVFSFTSSICSMLGPVGQTAAAAINLGTGISKAVIGSPNITDKHYENMKLPTGFKRSLNAANVEYYKNRIAYLDEQTSRALDAADNVTGNILNGVKTVAEKIRVDIDSLKSKIILKDGELDMKDISQIFDLEKSVDLMSEIAEKVSETLFDLGEKIEETNEIKENIDKLENVESSESSKKQAKVEIALKNTRIVKGLANGMKILKLGGILMKTIIDEQKDVEKMADAVKLAQQNVKTIEEKKNQFNKEILKNMQRLNYHLNKLTSELPDQSRVALTVKKWKIKGMLKNMRGFIFEFTQAMKVTEEFMKGFDTLDEALTLLIKLYDQIENYEEKKQLADFISNVNSANDLTQITDIELKQVLTRLDFYISANLFLEDYQKGIHAFKQWAFPFAHRYISQTKSEKLSHDLPAVISSYKRQVESLSHALNLYASTTVHGDQYLMVNIFTSEKVSSEPFYKWTNEKWKGAVKKLLAGEPVRLKADVDMVDQKSALYFKTKSAIKYKSLALVLKTRDKTRQTELDRTLDHFHMTMTHSGISLYKIMGQHFVMYDTNITYIYSFEKTKDNNYVTVNGVKYKVDGPGADFLMSPYTWWTFQITDAKEGGLGFLDLEQFEDEVDLELEGKGVYIEESRVSPQHLSDLKLADYYEMYDPEKKWNLNEEDNKDKCIVSRADLTEAEKNEVLEPELNLTSLATNSADPSEWGTFSNVAVICSVVGVVMFLFGLVFYFKKEYFLEYISVPVRADNETKKEEEEENNELMFLS